MKYILIAAVFLASCGGGDPEPECKPTIQLFGDSTFDAELGASPYWIARWGSRVTNRAVGGTNSRELRAGIDGKNLPWPGSVAADVVVINHGLRDGYTPYEWAYTPLPEYIANLRHFADNANGAKVIFQTPLPSTIPARDMTDYAQAMRDVAEEKGLDVIDVFACFKTLPNYASHLPDGTHPDEAGKVKMTECAAPLVERFSCRH